MNEILKTSEVWYQHPDYEGITILDPDGWDRENFTASWSEPITQEEFNQRLGNSTLRIDYRADPKILQRKEVSKK